MAEKLTITINSGYNNPSKEFTEVVQFFLDDTITGQIRDSFSYIYDSETDEVEFSFCYQPEQAGTLDVPILFEINNRGTLYEAVRLGLTLDGPQVNPTWIARIPAYGRIVREIYNGQSTVQKINPSDYNPTIGTNYYKQGNNNNYITKDSYEDFIRSQEVENHPLDEVGRTQYTSSTYYKIYKTLELKCNALEGKDKDSYGNYYTNSREVGSYIVTGLYTYDLYDESQNLLRENVEESTSLITLRNETNRDIEDSIGILWVPQPDPDRNIGESYNYNYVGLLYYEDFSGNVKSIKSRNHITVERYINAEFGGEDGTPVYYEQKYPLYILGPLKNNTITVSIQLVKKEVGQESLPRLSNIKFNGTPIENTGALKFHNYKYNSIFVYNYNEEGEIIEDSGEFQTLFEITEMRYEASSTEGKLIFKVRAALDNDELDPWRPSYASILPVLEVSTISFDKDSTNFTAEYPYYIVQKSTKIGIIPQRFPSRDSKTGENLPRSKNEPEKYELKIDGTIGVKTAFVGITSEVDPYDENIVRNWAITEKMEIGNRERFYFFEKYSGDLLEKIVLYTSVNNMTLPEFYVRDYIDRSTEWRRALYESEVTIIPVVENTGSIVDLGGGWSYRLEAPTPFFLGHNLLFIFNNSNRYIVKRFNLYFSGPENQQINDGSGNSNNVLSASINGFNVLGGPEGYSEDDEELNLTYTHYGLRDVIYDKLYPGATPHDLYTLEDIGSTYDNGNLEPMAYNDNEAVKIDVETDSFIFVRYNTGGEDPETYTTVNLDNILILGSQFYKVVPMSSNTSDETGYGLIKLDDIIPNVSISTTNLNINGDIYYIGNDKSLTLIENSTSESVRIEVEYTILVITEGGDKHFYVVEVTSEDEQGKHYGLREITITAQEGETIFSVDSLYYTIASKYTLGRYKSLTSIKARSGGDKREIFFGYIGCWGNYVYFDIIYPQKIKNIPSGIFKTPSDNYFLRFIFTLSDCYAASTDPQEIQFWCGTENIDPLHLLPVNGLNAELIPSDWNDVQGGYPSVPLTSDTSKFNLASKTVSSEYSDWKVNFPFENRFVYSAPNGTKIINERTLGEDSYIPDEEKNYLLVERKDDDGGSDIVDFLRIGDFPNFYYDWKFYIYNRLQSRFEFFSSAGSNDFTIGDGTNNITELELNKIGLYRLYISTLNNLGDDIEADLSFEVRCGSNRPIIENNLYLTKSWEFGIDSNNLEDPSKLKSVARGESIKIGQGYSIDTSKGSSYILYLWYEGAIDTPTVLNNLNARIVFTYTITTTGRTLSKSIPLIIKNDGNISSHGGDEFFRLEPYKNINDSLVLGKEDPIQYERIKVNNNPVFLRVDLKKNINNANYVGIPIIGQAPGYIDLVNINDSNDYTHPYPYKLSFSEEQEQGKNFDWLVKEYRCEINSPDPDNGNITATGCYIDNSYRKSFYKFSVNPEVDNSNPTKKVRMYYHTNEAHQVVNINFQDQTNVKMSLKIIYYPPIDPNQFFLGYSHTLGYVKGATNTIDRPFYVNENYKAYVDNGHDYIHHWLNNTIRFNYDQGNNEKYITIHKDESDPLLGATDRLVFKEIKNSNLELVTTIWKEDGTTASLSSYVSKNIVTSGNDHVLRFKYTKNGTSKEYPELRWRVPTEGDRSSFQLKVFCDGEREHDDGTGLEATNTPLYMFERFKEDLNVPDECEQVNYYTLATFRATYDVAIPSEVNSTTWQDFWNAMYDSAELTSRYFGVALQYKGSIDIISGISDDVLSDPEILPCTDNGLQYGNEYNPRFLIPLGMFGTGSSHTINLTVNLEEAGLDELISPANLISTVDILYKDGEVISSNITPTVDIPNKIITISFSGTLTKDIIVQPHFTNIEYNCLKGNLSWNATTGGAAALRNINIYYLDSVGVSASNGNIFAINVNGYKYFKLQKDSSNKYYLQLLSQNPSNYIIMHNDWRFIKIGSTYYDFPQITGTTDVYLTASTSSFSPKSISTSSILKIDSYYYSIPEDYKYYTALPYLKNYSGTSVTVNMEDIISVSGDNIYYKLVTDFESYIDPEDIRGIGENYLYINNNSNFRGCIVKDSQKFRLVDSEGVSVSPVTIEAGYSINILGSGYYTIVSQGSRYKLNLCNPININLGENRTLINVPGFSSYSYYISYDVSGRPEFTATTRNNSAISVTLKSDVLLINGKGYGYYVNTSPHDSSKPYLFEVTKINDDRTLIIGDNEFIMEKDYSGLLNSLGRVNDSTNFGKLLRTVIKGSSITLGFNIDSNSRTYSLSLKRKGYGNAFLIQPGVFYKYVWNYTYNNGFSGEIYPIRWDEDGNGIFEELTGNTGTASNIFYKIWYSFYEPSDQDDRGRDALLNEINQVHLVDGNHPFREIYILFPQRKNDENRYDFLLHRNWPKPLEIYEENFNIAPYQEDCLVTSSIIGVSDNTLNYTAYSGSGGSNYKLNFSEIDTNSWEYSNYKFYTKNPEYYYLVAMKDKLLKPAIDSDQTWITEGGGINWGGMSIPVTEYTNTEASKIGPWTGVVSGEIENIVYEGEEGTTSSDNLINYVTNSGGDTITYYNIHFLEKL